MDEPIGQWAGLEFRAHDALRVTAAIREAEARGWQRAVEALRDENAILRWSWEHRHPDVPVDFAEIEFVATYLESLSSQPAEESTDA